MAASVDCSSDTFEYIAGRGELAIRRFVGDRAVFLTRRPDGEERRMFDLPRVREWQINPQGDQIAYVIGGSANQPPSLRLRTIGRDDERVVDTCEAVR